MAPLTTKILPKSGGGKGRNREKEGKIRKNREKEDKSVRKGKNREGYFTLPLLTNHSVGYATDTSMIKVLLGPNYQTL